MNYNYNSFNFRVDNSSALFFLKVFIFVFILFKETFPLFASEIAAEEKTYAEKKLENFEKQRKLDILKKLKDDITEKTILYSVLEDMVIDYFGVDGFIKSNENLSEASKTGDFEIVKELVENGADINSKDINGKIALDFAREGYWELYGDGQSLKEADIEKLENFRKIIKFLSLSGKK